MRRLEISSFFIIILTILGLCALAHVPREVGANSTTFFVDNDNVNGPWDGSQAHPYQNITSGLKYANPGDTLFVSNGLYVENIVVNKSVSIIGEDQINTVIDGRNSDSGFLPVIHVFDVDNLMISSLTVQNSSLLGAGILLWNCDNITVKDCVIKHCYYGCSIGNSIYCKIYRNEIVVNNAYGIHLRSSSNNLLIENLVAYNPTGIYVEDLLSKDNYFYRNNMNNSDQVSLFNGGNYWDNGAEGNYWEDYVGVDSNGDGIGDSSYFGIDQFPLIEPWSPVRIYPGNVIIVCNFTVATFEFNDVERKIGFFITGPVGWKGFCNITIPFDVMKPENTSESWLVLIGSNPKFYLRQIENNSTILSCKYSIGSLLSERKFQITIVEGYLPTANFNFIPDKPIITESVSFIDNSVPGNGTILWRHWDFGDGTTLNTTDESSHHNYAFSGNFTVTLSVFDTFGFADSVSRIVTVIQHPSANFTYSPLDPVVGEEVVFNASSSYDSDGSLTMWTWNFSDELQAVEGEVVTHVFRDVGEYNVTLTIQDNHGLTDTVSKVISVVEGGLDYSIILIIISVSIIVIVGSVFIWRRKKVK